MRPEFPLRRIFPPVLAPFFPFKVDWINDPVFGNISVANDQKRDILCGVIDEAMRKAGACGKTHPVTGSKPVQKTIQPDIRLACDHVDKFLLAAFGMGQRRPAPRG